MALVKNSGRVHNRIMKHTYSFLSGVGLVSLCVVFTHSLPGYMFLIGFATCLLSTLLLGRAMGANRIARFFFYLSERKSMRFASHWNSDAENTAPVPQVSRRVPSNRAEMLVNVANPDTDSRFLNRRGLEGHIPDRSLKERPSSPKARDIRTRRYSSTARNATSRQSSVVNCDVLPQTQQDVLSALVNLKVPFANAEQAVLGAAQREPGASFDDMFRTALALVQAGQGKSRRVA